MPTCTVRWFIQTNRSLASCVDHELRPAAELEARAPRLLRGVRRDRLALPTRERYRSVAMIRTILHYPDKRLRDPARTVSEFTPALHALIDDMAETMYAAPGVGLAAPQIGEALRLFIIDIADESEPSDLRVFINPEILESNGKITWEEGCLSFPGITEEIERSAHVKVRAQDRSGEPFELEAQGLLAVAIQHEFDHIQGTLMIDRMGALKKRLTHRKMVKRAGPTASREN